MSTMDTMFSYFNLKSYLISSYNGIKIQRNEGMKMVTSQKPKYVEIYNQLRHDIIAGTYPEGSYLPTETNLMQIFSASRTTIRSAIRLLKADNFLRVTQGRGTEILPVAHQQGYAFTLMGKTEVSTDFEGRNTADIVGQPSTIDIIPATKKIAENLEMVESESVYRLQREKIIGDISFLYVVSYLRCKDFPELEKNDGKIYFLYKFLEEHYDMRFSSTKIKITATAADFIQSRLLDVPVGSPLLEQARHAYSDKGVFEYSLSYCRPEYMSISVSTAPEDTQHDPFLTRGF